MARRLMMLRKKVQELESDVFGDQTAAELDDIKERLRFLDKLRAAEADSDSDQLRDLDERIAHLKTAIRNNDDDAHSICSDCNLQQTLLLEDFSAKNKLSEEEGKEAPAPAGRMGSGFGKYCGAFGCGMIIGMVLGLFYAHYLIVDEPFFIHPT